MKDEFKEILSDFNEWTLPDIIKREIDVPVNSGKIITLIGPRRSGKSYCLLYLIKQLLKKRIQKKQIVYVNFEDERLEIKASDLDDLLKAQRELYPGIDLSSCYFFFDEIQNITGWDKFVRRCYDSISKHVFITGSNATLLSTEIASSLRGRTLTYELLTLSFKEYLTFKGIATNKQDSASKADVNRALKTYLNEGGFPEIVLGKPSSRVKVLQEYFNVMLYRDLIQRYKFTNLDIVRFFLKRNLAANCSYLSLNKVYLDLRSQGYKLDKNLLYQVNEAAKAVYLTMNIKKFDYSELKSLKSDSKTYCVDIGLLSATTFNFDSEITRLFENAIFLHYRRTQTPMFYYKNGKECDFVIYNQKKKQWLPVQACYDMRKHLTFEREVAGLVSCCKALNIKAGLIVTMFEEKEIIKDSIKISIVKLVDFWS